jgi:protein with PEP-CTERM/exosortase system signal
MRKYTLLALLAASCAVMLAFGSNAQALTFGDGNDLGQVLFGIPSGDQDRTDYVNHLVGMTAPSSDTFQGQDFNRTSNSCGTCAPVAVVDITNGTGTNIDLGAGGSLYLFAKYDGKNAGSEVWNIQGLTGIITIPAQGLQADIDAGHPYGLSGWSIWGGTPTTTPDAGATAALLGLGLAGLAGLRARFGRH